MQVRCPRCGTSVERVPGAALVCPACGFSGPVRAPSVAPRAAPPPAAAPATPPPASPAGRPSAPASPSAPGEAVPSAPAAPASAFSAPGQSVQFWEPPSAPAPPKRSRVGLWVALAVVGGLMMVVVLAAVVFVLVSDLGRSLSCGDDAKFEEDGIGFCHPTEWEAAEGLAGTRVAVLAPLDGSGDDFQENVNVVVARRSGDDLEEEEQAVLAQIAEVFDGFRHVRSDDARVDGVRAVRIVYEGSQGGYVLHGEMTLLHYKDAAVAITYTAEQGAEEQYRGEVARILGSFRLT